jgi:hypothetical protein
MAHSLSDRSLPALQVSPPHARRTRKLPAWPLFGSLTAITAAITTTITGYCKRATTRPTTTSWSSPGSSSMVSCTSRDITTPTSFWRRVCERAVKALLRGLRGVSPYTLQQEWAMVAPTCLRRQGRLLLRQPPWVGALGVIRRFLRHVVTAPNPATHWLASAEEEEGEKHIKHR